MQEIVCVRVCMRVCVDLPHTHTRMHTRTHTHMSCTTYTNILFLTHSLSMHTHCRLLPLPYYIDMNEHLQTRHIHHSLTHPLIIYRHVCMQEHISIFVCSSGCQEYRRVIEQQSQDGVH